ncbi:MAG: AAA family ATPase [Deltaproteobacteria bacterium]|jgi:predicted ATP-dependent protease|nr:AAA family ATPase [Deltaproteobacteria bacterium]
MKKISPLPPQALQARLPESRIPWANSADMPARLQHNGIKHCPQPRALHALELALHINAKDYHVYLSGESNLGRRHMLREFLQPRARKEPTPPDLLYVNNFAVPDKALLIAVPAGHGHKIKNAMAETLGKIRKELPGRFEADSYMERRVRLMDRFQKTRDRLLRKMDAVAGAKGFHLDFDAQGGLTLYPLVEGKRLNEEEFDRLDAQIRQRLKHQGDSLLHAMVGFIRQLNRAEQGFKDDERSLEREVVRQTLDSLLTPLEEKILRACPEEALQKYFKALREDILNNLEQVLPREGQTQQAGDAPQPTQDNDPYRYDINLFVDNGQTSGAPIIVDDHPTSSNLLGCVEREAEMGALVTDFTLIKAGSLHKANGGFLVLNMDDMLQYPAAWEGLMRSLRSGLARIEDSGEMDASTRTKGIEPEALRLALRVVLVGSENLYETLLLNDERFSKLFKIKAHMTDVTRRDQAGLRVYLARMARIIAEAGLLTFERSAMARLVDFGSELSEDRQKLSLKFPLLRELMIEASALASMAGADKVDRGHVESALDAREYRVNLAEELFLEEYDRKLIKVHTSGVAVGRVNGLSVTWRGNYEFGLPHCISCAVGVGHGGIIDLEREAKLSGPIHTKAMMIMKSYLLEQFARDKPLVMTGSLCFEQSYAGVEGDSASGAELAALLSALSDIPVRLSLAFTGAVGQSGQITAVGGVSRKLEGLFQVCARHGLTGEQGVIIPSDNLDHLLLSRRVADAVESGRFAVYPVQHITEALELLTGLPAGRRRKDGSFTPGSIYQKVDSRLVEMGKLAAKAYKRPDGRR